MSHRNHLPSAQRLDEALGALAPAPLESRQNPRAARGEAAPDVYVPPTDLDARHGRDGVQAYFDQWSAPMFEPLRKAGRRVGLPFDWRVLLKWSIGQSHRAMTPAEMEHLRAIGRWAASQGMVEIPPRLERGVLAKRGVRSLLPYVEGVRSWIVRYDDFPRSSWATRSYYSGKNAMTQQRSYGFVWPHPPASAIVLDCDRLVQVWMREKQPALYAAFGSSTPDHGEYLMDFSGASIKGEVWARGGHTVYEVAPSEPPAQAPRAKKNPSTSARDLAEFLQGSVHKEPVFHGSRTEGLTSLRPDAGSEYGIYVSPMRSYAARYGDVVYKGYINIQHPLVVGDKSEISSSNITREDVARLARNGYDSIVSGAHEIVLFNESQLMLV